MRANLSLGFCFLLGNFVCSPVELRNTQSFLLDVFTGN